MTSSTVGRPSRFGLSGLGAHALAACTLVCAGVVYGADHAGTLRAVRESVEAGEQATAAAALERCRGEATQRGRSEGVQVSGCLAELGAALQRNLVAPGSELPYVTAYRLSVARLDQGDFEGAEILLTYSIAGLEKLGGGSTQALSSSISQLGRLYLLSGRVEPALREFNRSLAIRRGTLGPFHPLTADALHDLSLLHQFAGRPQQARQFALDALQARELSLGPSHSLVARSLSRYAVALLGSGEHALAERTARRALRQAEAVHGGQDPAIANALSTLALVLGAAGRRMEALPLLERALDAMGGGSGSDDPRIAPLLDGLASLQLGIGAAAAAERNLRRALGLASRFGADTIVATKVRFLLAEALRLQGRNDEADSLLRRALGAAETLHGEVHPITAAILHSLAFLALERGRAAEALPLARRANASLLAGAQAQAAAGDVPSALALLRSRREHLTSLVDLLGRVVQANPSVPAQQREALLDESFQLAQLARSSGTGVAVARAMTRLALADEQIAALLRRREEDIAARRALERAYQSDAAGLSTLAPYGALDTHMRLSAVDRRLREVQAALAARHPAVAAFADLSPVGSREIRGRLRAGEAMLSFLVGPGATHAWLLRQDRVVHARLAVSGTELEGLVARLRRSLDLSAGEIEPFPVTVSHRLYRSLLLPLLRDLDGITSLAVVPDAALESLPLGVLVIDPVVGDAATDYRSLRWLGDRFALATLPSEGVLKVSRDTAHASRAPEPFVGFGDPSFAGPHGAQRRSASALFAERGIADLRELARLAPLPESGDEIRAMSETLGADQRYVFLRERATERQLRALDLSRFRVIALATHGLVSGDFDGLAEPALALTPPTTASETDDGLLTASEIVALKLDADLVVLSACNTAAADGTPGAEGLSGLAKAFFSAGSRSLLVSHWPVDSLSATQLTTGMLRVRAEDPSLSLPEALRRSSQTLRLKSADRRHAHPAFWAPFVMVGSP